MDKPMVAVGEIMKGDESSFLLPKDTKLCPCSSVRRSLKVVNQSNSNIYDTKRSNLKYLLGHLLQFLPAAKPRRSMDHKITVGGRRGGRVLICLLGKFCEMKRRIGVTFSPWKIL